MELISAPTRLMHSPSFRPQVNVNRTSIASNIKNPSWISPKSVYFQRNHTKIGPFCTKWSLNVRNEGFIGGERSGVGDRDGVIIVDHGSRRRESNLMLNEFVGMFRDKTGYPIVEPAHMELAEPSIKDAFYSCVLQGANRVIVSPFFLFPGRHWHQDIPSLAAEAAKEHPGVSYIITAPLGLHELMVNCMIRVWIEEATLAIYGHMLPHPANIHQPSDSTQHPVARMS